MQRDSNKHTSEVLQSIMRANIRVQEAILRGEKK